MQFFIAVTHIEPRGAIRRDEIAKGVNAVFSDDIDRIDPVSEGFRHLPAQLIAHDAVDVDGVERRFPRVFQTGEDHSRDPEEDYIISGDEHACRIEMLEIIGLFGPAEC